MSQKNTNKEYTEYIESQARVRKMREQIEGNENQNLMKRKISCVEKTKITFYNISKISMFKVQCIQKDNSKR